jgi:hypothetical protein
MAWVHRLSGLIKVAESVSAFRGATQVKVENVSKKRIWIIDLNHHRIPVTNGIGIAIKRFYSTSPSNQLQLDGSSKRFLPPKPNLIRGAARAV